MFAGCIISSRGRGRREREGFGVTIPNRDDPRMILAITKAALGTTAAMLEMAAKDAGPSIAHAYRKQVKAARELANAR
jgi:hypothetical protein